VGQTAVAEALLIEEQVFFPVRVAEIPPSKLGQQQRLPAGTSSMVQIFSKGRGAARASRPRSETQCSLLHDRQSPRVSCAEAETEAKRSGETVLHSPREKSLLFNSIECGKL